LTLKRGSDTLKSATNMKAWALAAILIFSAGASTRAADAVARPTFAVTPLPAAAEKAGAPSSAPPEGIDRDGLDIDVVEKYDEAVKFEQGDDEPADKAQAWRSLAQDVPALSAAAEKRAKEWDLYAQSAATAAAAARARLAARDADWDKLAALLSGTAATKADKRAWTAAFFAAYAKSPGIEPVMAKAMLPSAPPGAMKDALKKTASRVPAPRAAPPTGATAPAAR